LPTVRARLNYTRTVGKLYDVREREFGSARELGAFIDDIARSVNDGLLRPGVLLRVGDSTQYPYTPVARLPDAHARFCAELFERLHDPSEDPIETAAWVEYRVDLTDHFYADGAGKTARALASFVLMRAGHALPTYPDRAELYRHAPTVASEPDSAVDRAQLDAWRTFYRGLF
jgi:hypothetical protein